MKILRNILIILFVIVNILLFTYFIMDEDIPETESGLKAEQLADRMFLYLNKDAFEKTDWYKFQAFGRHKFIWDKNRNFIQVDWQNNTVKLNTKTGESIVLKDGKEVLGDQKKKLTKKATDYFNNDSFWFFAPYKVRDNGTQLSYKKINDTLDGLLVTYTSGGSTPGDSYLWAIDDNGKPHYWKMWTSVIPIGGFPTNWRQWEPLNSGAMIARERSIWLMSLDFNHIIAGDNHSDIGLAEDPFIELTL